MAIYYLKQPNKQVLLHLNEAVRQSMSLQQHSRILLSREGANRNVEAHRKQRAEAFGVQAHFLWPTPPFR